MNEQLEQYLKDNYPEIIPENFYFECGDGWFLIIDALCSKLRGLADRAKTEPPTASQIKEKFGGLRFYIDPLDSLEWGEYVDAVYAVVNMAETLSFRTCESCGRAGFPRDAKWTKCYCRWCATDGRPTFNQEWVNGCLEMIEEEKVHKRQYKEWQGEF